jgi:hypothetical protein
MANVALETELLAKVPMPWGQGLTVESEAGISGSEAYAIVGLGKYGYLPQSNAQSTYENHKLEGRVFLEGNGDAPILVVSPGCTGDSPPLPLQIQQQFPYVGVWGGSNRGYTVARPGEEWLLTYSCQDVYIIAPGYATVKLENTPTKDGEMLVLPDIWIPKENIQWLKSPPEDGWASWQNHGLGWHVVWALYPQ